MTGQPPNRLLGGASQLRQSADSQHATLNRRDETLVSEYERGAPVDKIFTLSSTGIMTNRDNLTIAPSRRALKEQIQRFIDPNKPDHQVSEEMKLSNNSVWSLSEARVELRQRNWQDTFTPIDYRPFDERVIAYDPTIVGNLRRPVMKQLRETDNLCLLACRQQIVPGFHHAFVTRKPFECCLVSLKSREKTSGFPLWRLSEGGQLIPGERTSNLKGGMLRWLAFSLLGHQPDQAQSFDALSVIYAELYSNSYRSGLPQVWLTPDL